MPSKPVRQPNESRITRFLHVVEWLGNALPHPVTLFAMFAAFVVVLSGILGFFEVSVVDPRPEGARGRADNGMIEVVSLMNAEGLRLIVLNLVRNFVEFAPLGTVLVALLGVGVAERSGWLTAVIRGMVLKAPPSLVTVIIVLAGVLSNTASEMGYVVLVPLAAVVFYALGRHPLAGLLFANGFSGHGLQHAAATGRGLAEYIIHGDYQSIDLDCARERLVRGEGLVRRLVARRVNHALLKARELLVERRVLRSGRRLPSRTPEPTHDPAVRGERKSFPHISWTRT